MNDVPFVLCIDVGGPKKVGWADSAGHTGTGADLHEGLHRLSEQLDGNGRASLGFEAPIWTPTRQEFQEITRSRGGIEKKYNRAWSAGAGVGALGAGLALMPWCMAQIVRAAGPVPTTVVLQRFVNSGGLFLWEAFVSGNMKTPGASHLDDAQLACGVFARRWPGIISDVTPEPALNHAVSSALNAGLAIAQDELSIPAVVIGATADSES